jgi:hypothetical protein
LILDGAAFAAAIFAALVQQRDPALLTKPGFVSGCRFSDTLSLLNRMPL